MLSERATFCFEVMEKISVEDDFLPTLFSEMKRCFVYQELSMIALCRCGVWKTPT
jgi:hypothetical protein